MNISLFKMIENKILTYACIILLLSICMPVLACSKTNIQNGNVVYDFTFAELAVKYFETGDEKYIEKIAETDAAHHIYGFAKEFSHDVFDYGYPLNSSFDFCKAMLTPFEAKKESLSQFSDNLEYARKKIAAYDIPRQISRNYLPEDFEFRKPTYLFFTFGFDMGVAYNGNASLNLAHPHFLQYKEEIRYYSIHELHHAGYLQATNDNIPALDFKTYSDVSSFIELFTHLEGMATYSPLRLRMVEDQMNSDEDYVALQDSVLMNQLEKEFFDIYYHFNDSPEKVFRDNDWEIIFRLSQKRYFYRIGAMMAKIIDDKLGRKTLVDLINEPPIEFFNTYMGLIK